MDNITQNEGFLFTLEGDFNKFSSAKNISFNISQETMLEDIDPILVDVFESPTFRVSTLFAYILLIPIGCSLLFLMIHYEHFGGDPQKRSIFNQIIAFLAAIELVTGIITEHIFIARIFFGCLPSGIVTCFWFINKFKHVACSILILTAATYKVLGMYNFRKIAGLNDDSLSIFFLLASIMTALIFTFVCYMFGHVQSTLQTIIMTCNTDHEVVTLKSDM